MDTACIIIFPVVILLLSALIYIFLDFTGPAEICLKDAKFCGLSCLKAKDLIVQESDISGNIWATRGMIIYLLKKSDTRFIRISHVPTGFSMLWFNNFRIIRRLTGNSECLEIAPASDGSLSVFSAGKMWYKEANRKSFRIAFRLSNYGIGKGRGIISNGLLNTDNNSLFFGEYFRNDNRTPVRIYKSENRGRSWEIAFEFKPGSIKHIHSLQKDPYTGTLWICTGDYDNESMIGYSNDEFKSIVPVGMGSQAWRTCQLAFTEDAIYWGTDTESDEPAGIYRWDKKTMELTRLKKIKGAVFFATSLEDGTIIMSTDREGYPNEEDDRTRLFIIDKEDKSVTVECGTWDRRKSRLFFKYAKLRMQRNQGFDQFVLSCLNHKDVPEGDLLIFPQHEFSEMKMHQKIAESGLNGI